MKQSFYRKVARNMSLVEQVPSLPTTISPKKNKSIKNMLLINLEIFDQLWMEVYIYIFEFFL